jgi:hypothetical protein
MDSTSMHFSRSFIQSYPEGWFYKNAKMRRVFFLPENRYICDLSIRIILIQIYKVSRKIDFIYMDIQFR